MFQMECDQRVIIKFLLNERADARDVADRLSAQCGEHADAIRTGQSWVAEVLLGRQVSIMKYALEGFLWTILMPELRLSWTNLLSNQLDR
jgi:hypothetical protein